MFTIYYLLFLNKIQYYLIFCIIKYNVKHLIRLIPFVEKGLNPSGFLSGATQKIEVCGNYVMVFLREVIGGENKIYKFYRFNDV